MAYMKKIRKTANQNIIEQKLYYSWRALPSIPKLQETRAKRIAITTQQQREINRRRATADLMMLIAENFKAGDLYLTLTYKGKVPPAEKIKKNMDNFLQNLRKCYKKKQERLKYIALLENLYGSGRGHGHILMNAIPDMDVNVLKKLWAQGRIKIELFGGSVDDSANLASYFKKERVEKNAGRIRTSQGLRRPREKKERVTRSECYNTAHIRPPKGYYMNKKLSILDGRTPEGYPYAYIIFVRDGT